MNSSFVEADVWYPTLVQYVNNLIYSSVLVILTLGDQLGQFWECLKTQKGDINASELLSLFPDLVELEEFIFHLQCQQSPKQDKQLSQGPSNLAITVKTRICLVKALIKTRLSDKTNNLKWRF